MELSRPEDFFQWRALLRPFPGGAFEPDFYFDLIGGFRSFGSFHWEQFPSGYCFHVIQGGAGVFEMDGTSHEAVVGDVFLFWPGAHLVYYDRSDRPWRYLWLSVSGRRVSEVFGSLGFRRESPLFRLGGGGEVFLTAVSEMVEEMSANSRDPLSPVSCAWRFVDMLTGLSGGRDAVSGGASDLAASAAKLLEGQLGEFLTVDELASKLGVSRSTLYRSFMETRGVSPKEYMLRRRFAKAKELLTRTQRSVKEISYLCGFHEPSYFNYLFRKRFGAPPRRWREGWGVEGSMSPGRS